jgi:hypothetical protein
MERTKLEYMGKKYFKSSGKWYSHLGERKPEMDAVLDKELSNIENSKLWVGEINGETVVLDEALSDSGSAVTYWLLSEDRFVEFDQNQAKASANKLGGEGIEEAIENYRRSVVVRHRLRFQRMGKKYSGIRKSNRRVPRETHCWSCKRTLTSEGFPECVECGWILCECGACGCGRRQA